MTDPAQTSRSGVTDHLSKAGATFLAAQLDEYWRRTGARTVRHWIEPGGMDRTSHAAAKTDGHTVWVVRSNLVRGNPPRQPSPNEPFGRNASVRPAP